MVDPLKKDSRILVSVILLAAYFIFVILTAVVNYILPFWAYFLLLLGVIVAAVLLSFLPKISPSAGGKRSLDYSSGIKSAIKVMIVLAFFYWMYDQGIAERADRVYDANELLKYKVSGDYVVEGNELVCKGPGSCELFIPNKKNIGKIKINPGLKPFKAMNLQVGHYLVEYSQGTNFYEFGGTQCGRNVDKGNYYKAMISYYIDSGPYKGWNHVVNSCDVVSIPEGSAPQEIYFGTTWLRIPDGFLRPIHQPEDPEFRVGEVFISNSRIAVDDQVYLGGDITLSSGKGETIKNVEIIFSSYSLGEFASKITKFG